MPKVRSIFLSDIPLGTRACQAARLLDFLREHESDHVYLVGDIVDFWAMQRSIQWTAEQNTVVQKILKRARHQGNVVYVPGNHDEALREYVGLAFGDIRVVHDCVHTAADGRRYLVIHGDEFDGVVKYARWLALLGDSAYTFALFVNRHFNTIRRKLGYPYWSLSAYLKKMVKNAVEYIASFERALAEEAQRRGFDGVVCGHIHHAEIREIHGILYCNDGDWVESCTALAEHPDGRLEIIDWSVEMHKVPVLALAS